jgi:hypothetical protein
MALNLTSVLRRVEMELGVSHRVIELMSDQLIRTVKEESVQVFSQYYPHLMKHVINEKEDRVNPKMTGRYYIKVEDWEILGVSKFLADSMSQGIASPYYAPYQSYQDPFDAQIGADRRSMVEEPITWKWIPPNQVETHQKWIYGGNLTIEIKVVHHEDLWTIPLTYREEFMKLALLDCKIATYAIRSQFSQINSPFGNIELNVDDLREAPQKREELLEKWRGNFGKQANRRKIWVG